MFFNHSFAPHASSVILMSWSLISLLWRGKGLYLEDIPIFLEVGS